jgi:glycosyltransferase involved in cell wall biosynthesis
LSVQLTVVIPTHNPHGGRLDRTLAGLRAQSLTADVWELVIVDNASTPRLGESLLGRDWTMAVRIVREPQLGLTAARLRGFNEARGAIVVLVDDDNVLAPDYLAHVVRRFTTVPNLAAAGGPVVPEWETPPPTWSAPFHGLLALRDLGPPERIARGGPGAPWPNFAPVGAGLAIRRADALAYADALAREPERRGLDRTGSQLTSGGDNDLVFTALHRGGDIGYFPDLRVTHLIPAARLEPSYLARLNRGIMRSWVRVLARHGQCPWRPIAPTTVALRVAKAWIRERPWRSPAALIRWSGARGQFEGLADIHRSRATL